MAGAAAGAAALTLPGLAKAASLADIKTRGVLNVATEDDYQPFEFFKDNVLTGFDIELLKLLEPNSSVQDKRRSCSWTGILPGVVTG